LTNLKIRVTVEKKTDRIDPSKFGMLNFKKYLTCWSSDHVKQVMRERKDKGIITEAGTFLARNMSEIARL
jgi:hypothetical protein